MKTVKYLVCFSLMAALATGALADDTEKKGRKRRANKPTATKRFVAKMELTDDQKKQVAEIDKKFAEPFTALQKKMADLLTPEQKKAQKEAMAAAKEAGTKGAEARKAVQEALNLTDVQKAGQKELMAARRKMDTAVIAALKKVLTEEQQEKLPKLRQQGGDKKGGKKGKKKANADKDA